jgi:hypothetical protein
VWDLVKAFVSPLAFWCDCYAVGICFGELLAHYKEGIFDIRAHAPRVQESSLRVHVESEIMSLILLTFA